MPLLGWIIVFTALGGIASAALASAFLLLPERTSTRLLPHFVSFATGALLGAALRHARMHQQHEVPQPVRDLVGRNGKRGHQPEGPAL